ncbi:MAG: amino acid permease [Bacteroidia bacterium]|nr:MAG: amino acid permease [Bacteroidia bacterium]
MLMSCQLDTTGKGVAIKDLSFVALFSLIFGSMMGSGVFDIPQNIAHRAGLIAVLISWVITAVGMFALAYTFIYITLKKPQIQSGIYGYAKHGFGDYIGFNSAWGYWLNALLGNASYLVYIFATLANFTIFKIFGNGTTIVALIGESFLIWLVYFLVARGIKEASIVNVLITTVKILALFTVIVIFIYAFKFARFKANFVFDVNFGSILTQVKSTMLVTVWDFLGIEAACIYALRAKKMADVVKATMFGGLVVFMIDALISVLPFGILEGNMISNLITPSTASILVQITSSNFAQLVRVAVIISVVGALLAWSMLATNIIYLAADDGAMPKFLGKLSNKKVPKNSLLVSMDVLQIFIIASYLTQSVYLAMIQLATSLILVPYFLAALYAFKLLLRERYFDILSVIKGILAILYGLWLIYAGGLKYLVFSTLLYSIGFVVYAIARKERGKNIFNNHYELFIFLFLLMVAIFSTILWAIGHLTLD